MFAHLYSSYLTLGTLKFDLEIKARKIMEIEVFYFLLHFIFVGT